MYTHEQMWQGIDRLAREKGLTASGLARRAGLDPTTFNPSKRVTKQNKPRWPSTESLAKILNATDTPFDSFVALVIGDGGGGPSAVSQRLRCVPLEEAGEPGAFDPAGFPVGDDWDEIDFPNLDDPESYALEVRGETLLPTYRDGDLLIVSPATGVRRHDRVVVRTLAAKVLVGALQRRTARRVEIAPFAHDLELQKLPIREVEWLARIVWVSQ